MLKDNLKLLEIDLHLFDGATGGGEGSATAESAAGATESAPKTAKEIGSSRRSKKGEFSNVIFGKQADVQADEGTHSAAGSDATGAGKDVETTSNTREERMKEFDSFMEQNKDLYSERFQSDFNKRFGSEIKGNRDALAAQKPIIDMLMQRYGVADGDMRKLQSALEEDHSYWEQAADEAGLTVEQYHRMNQIERENAELKQMRQRQVADQRAQQQMNAWYAEAEQVKQLYPAFNFRAEAQNKAFTDLLKAGIGVQKAFELVHMDEIKNATARAAAQTASEQMTAKIKSKAARPTENGISSQGAAIVKSDVHSLTKKERAEIARRVARGETISF